MRVFPHLVTGLAMLGAALLAPGRDAAGQETWARRVAERGCETLVRRVDAHPGDGPVFLRSFDGAAGDGANESPALATAAFTYDNALAAIALTACGRLPQAMRIGEALALAATSDRAEGKAGRLRNAYRAGPQAAPPPPNGWWDAAANQWLEDAYQVGTATGNVAWAALALLTLAEAADEPRFVDAARRLAEWAIRETADRRGAGGFSGGVHGDIGTGRVLTWKSTEHNVDLDAVFRRLDRLDAGRGWIAHADAARTFVAAQWLDDEARFLTGVLPDGVSPNWGSSGLDAQLWPPLLPDAPSPWRRALAYAERAHGVDGGFSFNHDRGGLWTEGTAQAALLYRVLGHGKKAESLLRGLAGMFAPGGYLWATGEGTVKTGLAIGPDSVTDDLVYYRLPHLGATAWAVLAAKGWNPFDISPLRARIAP